MDGPPFSYKIGLHDKGLPELIVVGLEVPHAEALLSVIAHKMFEGVRAGQLVIDKLRYPIWLIDGGSDLIGSEYALAAATRSEGRARYLQVCWPDYASGAYPWEARCAPENRELQPVLGPAPQRH